MTRPRAFPDKEVPGMLLEDYFAIRFAQTLFDAILSEVGTGHLEEEDAFSLIDDIPKRAYQMARDMTKERERGT